MPSDASGPQQHALFEALRTARATLGGIRHEPMTLHACEAQHASGDCDSDDGFSSDGLQAQDDERPEQ
eukprot:8960720-Lingulodinium_polyedra.AAC.1